MSGMLQLGIATMPSLTTPPATINRTDRAGSSAPSVAGGSRSADSAPEKPLPFDDVMAAVPLARPAVIRSPQAASAGSVAQDAKALADNSDQTLAVKRLKPGRLASAQDLSAIALTATSVLATSVPALVAKSHLAKSETAAAATEADEIEPSVAMVIASLQPAAAQVATGIAVLSSPALASGSSRRLTSNDQPLPVAAGAGTAPALVVAPIEVAISATPAATSSQTPAEADMLAAAPITLAVLAAPLQSAALASATGSLAQTQHAPATSGVHAPLTTISPVSTATGATASASIAATGPDAATMRSPTSFTPTPSDAPTTVKRLAARSSELRSASAAIDSSQPSDGTPTGMAVQARWALQSTGPSAPPRQSEQLPSAAILADPFAATGEPGFSIDSRLLGPVSAALTALDAAGDRLHVQFTVDRPATAALITSGSDRLDLTLSATGVRLASLAVSVDPRALTTTSPEPQRAAPPGSPLPDAGSSGSAISNAWSAGSASQGSAPGSGARDPRREQQEAGSPPRAVRSPTVAALTRDRFA